MVGWLVCLSLRVWNDVYYDEILQKCAAWLGERQTGRQLKLLESKRRDKRFDNRVGGTLGIECQEESQRRLLVPNLCIGENKPAFTYKELQLMTIF